MVLRARLDDHQQTCSWGMQKQTAPYRSEITTAPPATTTSPNVEASRGGMACFESSSKKLKVAALLLFACFCHRLKFCYWVSCVVRRSESACFVEIRVRLFCRLDALHSVEKMFMLAQLLKKKLFIASSSSSLFVIIIWDIASESPSYSQSYLILLHDLVTSWSWAYASCLCQRFRVLCCNKIWSSTDAACVAAPLGLVYFLFFLLAKFFLNWNLAISEY